jgi:uncharacterized membrane protein SpoIIM required for sporulation
MKENSLHLICSEFVNMKRVFVSILATFLLGILIGYSQGERTVAHLKDYSQRQDLSTAEKKRIYKSLNTFNPNWHYKRQDVNNPEVLAQTLGLFLRNYLRCGIWLFAGLLIFIIPFIHALLMGILLGIFLKVGGIFALARRALPHGFLELPLILH